MAKNKKVRVDMRKNRSKPPRDRQWTRGFEEHGFTEESTKSGERVRAKGDLSRKRTIVQESTGGAVGDNPEMPNADTGLCVPGRVLRVHGLYSIVEAQDGRLFRCAVRGVLRTLATDERSVVTTGDRVWLLPAESRVRSQGSGVRSQESGVRSQESGVRSQGSGVRDQESGVRSQESRVTEEGQDDGALHADSLTPDSCLLTPVLEGVIERVEPRHGILTRESRQREHVLVANVDQVLIVMSLVEPELKPHLIDRYLASAERGGIRPIVCLNKADLIEPAGYQPLVGLYSQLGIPTLLTSAETGLGVAALKELLRGRQTVFSGQSGVGKSSLLNALQPGLGLRVREVSDVNQKGKHTTTTAELIRLAFGGWVVDTPGIRQFSLWQIRPEEMEGFFPEFRPFVTLCAFPDCTHTHEDQCAVKRAVERRQVSASRYHSYLGLFAGERT